MRISTMPADRFLAFGEPRLHLARAAVAPRKVRHALEAALLAPTPEITDKNRI